MQYPTLTQTTIDHIREIGKKGIACSFAEIEEWNWLVASNIDVRLAAFEYALRHGFTNDPECECYYVAQAVNVCNKHEVKT